VLVISLQIDGIQAYPASLYFDEEVMFFHGEVRPGQLEKQATPLEQGKPIERELGGGQTDSYQLTLTDGQYLKLVVDQRGVDVVVKLVGVDGKLLTEANADSRREGEETISWVAEAAGSYRVDVFPMYKNAVAGRYQIQLVELGVATEGDRVLQEARKLNSDSIRLFREGKYDEALLLSERVLDIREKTLGSDHQDVAIAVNNIGRLYYHKGDYAKAESFYQRALTIREKTLGPEHPVVAASLNNLALLYSDTGDYEKAESFYQRSLTIGEKSLGPEHPDVGVTLTNIAKLYMEIGEYEKAEPLYQRVQNIFEKALEPDHPYVGASLNNLANYYKTIGNYAKAEPLLKRTLALKEKVMAPENPNLAPSLINLANFYFDRGDNEKAEPLYARALAIREKALGPDHPDLARLLGNLAILYKDTGEYAKAEPLYARALRIREIVLGQEHIDVALALNDFARFYSEIGDYSKAEPLFQRSLAIVEKTVGPEHPAFAEVLNNLANLYRNRGDYATAEPLYGRALTIREKALGEEHPLFGESLADLSTLYAAKEDYAQAVAILSRANAVDERNLSLYLIGSERDKLNYLAKFFERTEFTLSLHSQAAANDPKALDLAFTTLLQRKARALEVMTDTIATLRQNATPEVRALFEQLTHARSQLASLKLIDSGTAKPETYRTRVKNLEVAVDKLEGDLSSSSEDFRNQFRNRMPVTLSAVQTAIPSGCTLVEFVYFTPWKLQPEKSKHSRYLAYLLTPQGQPKWVDLGEASSINQAIDDWRKALRDPNRNDVKRLARIVDEKLMRPVRSLLNKMSGDTRRLLIAPDSSLNLIPFAALVDEQNRYLVERFAISYLTSGRDLLRLQTTIPSRDAPLVVANPDFGRPVTSAPDGDRNPGKSAQVRIDPTRVIFQPLPNTEDESLAIKALLPKASVLHQEEATETAVKKVIGPRILHIATHGFFIDYQGPARTSSPANIRPVLAQANPYTVQLESTPELETAQETIQRLRAKGVDAYIIKSKVKGKGAFFRVRAGNFPSQADAKKYGADLREKGVADEFFVARYKPPPESLMDAASTIAQVTTKPVSSSSTDSQVLAVGVSDLRLSKFVSRVKDPLLRSGLALAGANEGRSGDDDGLLTALETASLYLSGTKLVVLSACDTGVGEVTNGEGVQGLRRALVLAGSESQVMSLWPVSDEATKDLMIPYYKALQQGEGRSEALRQVQLRILRGGQKQRHPFFWAAFIQSGEWANLEGKR